MKHTTKIWLITAVCLILIGAIVFCGVMAFHHWDFSIFSTSKYETKTFDISEEFRNIAIYSDTEDIVFVPADDGKCRVVLYEPKNIDCFAGVKDETLSIHSVDMRKWYETISLFSLETPAVTIYLPREEYAALTIEESTGDVEIPEAFRFASMDVTADTGDVTCCAAVSGPIQIAVSTGDIRIRNTEAGELRLTASTGSVDVSSVSCQGSVSVTVSTGKTMLTDLTCESVTSTGSTGEITFRNVIAAGSIFVERSTGDVRLDSSDAAELDIQTDTGDVTGTLCSEKVFIVRSDTGRIEVPETAAGGICRITTDTGDIRIEIN